MECLTLGVGFDVIWMTNSPDSPIHDYFMETISPGNSASVKPHHGEGVSLNE